VKAVGIDATSAQNHSDFTKRILEPLQLLALSFCHFSLLPHHSIV
jgi:hypothetical protein